MSKRHRPFFTAGDRVEFYNKIREQTDQPTAEYLSAHLLHAPVPELVTKDHLAAQLSRFATKEEVREGFAELRTELREQRAEDREWFKKQIQERAEDRKASWKEF